MSDLEKFHRMTKPMKHSRLRMFMNYVEDVRAGWKDRVLYYWNYMLYKLKRYRKRYSYRTVCEEEVVPYSFPFRMRSLITSNFSATVVPTMVKLKDANIDYFYKVFKSDSGIECKEITYINHFEEKERWYLRVTLKDIKLRIGDAFYDIEHLPVVKTSIMSPEGKPDVFNEEVTLPVYETKTYDTGRVRNLMQTFYLGLSDSDFSSDDLRDLYLMSAESVEEYLAKLNLSDLEVI